MRWWVLLFCVTLTGCGSADEPPDALVAVASGTYEAVQGTAPFPLGFPHEGGTDFQMVVDRAADVVEVRYVKAGTLVTEFWKIAATRHN